MREKKERKISWPTSSNWRKIKNWWKWQSYNVANAPSMYLFHYGHHVQYICISESELSTLVPPVALTEEAETLPNQTTRPQHTLLQKLSRHWSVTSTITAYIFILANTIRSGGGKICVHISARCGHIDTHTATTKRIAPTINFSCLSSCFGRCC